VKRPFAATLAPPTTELWVDGDGNLPSSMVAELASALGADGESSNELHVVKSATAGLHGGNSEPPRLAVASYDELKAASIGKAATRLTVMAPLATQELYVFVRADSPLRYLHELKQKRIDIGPAGGSRAVTVDLLYRKMFGAPMSETQVATVVAPDAMHQLVVGKTLDAVILLGSQAQTVLAAMPEEERRAVRLLALQRDNPESRRALQEYLPATLTGTAGTTVTSLASMNFLVATRPANARETERLGMLTTSLCRHLGKLQREGDPKWREVQAGLQLPIAIRNLDTSVIDTVWARCSPSAPSSSPAFK
jgi:hypothetical protein